MNNGKQLKQKLNDNPESWRATDDDVRQWADNHRRAEIELKHLLNWIERKKKSSFFPFAFGWLKFKSILN